MSKNIFYRIILSLFLVACFSSQAYALSLDEAKGKGLVGEQQNGYLGAVTNPNAEVSALLNSINQQRKSKYEEIAKKNGTNLSAVESLAAKKAILETAPGNYVQNASGAWVKK